MTNTPKTGGTSSTGPVIKSDWEKAVEVLVEHHFKRGRPEERTALADKFLRDIVNYQVNHLGCAERRAKAEVANAFSIPDRDRLRHAFRKYPSMGSF